jgi:hypothetical protein
MTSKQARKFVHVIKPWCSNRKAWGISWSSLGEVPVADAQRFLNELQRVIRLVAVVNGYGPVGEKEEARREIERDY